MAHRIAFDEIAWGEISPHARSQEWTGKGKRVRILEIRPEFQEAGWCAKAHVVYVLAGDVEIDFQGEVERFATGDVAVIAPEDRHKARALTAVARVLLIEDAG